MARRCIIISGGEYSPIAEINKDDFVIACDKGYEYALKDRIKPQLIVGDFDSYLGDLDTSIPIQKYKCEKDDTDTAIAIKYAIENKFDEIVIYCALGGRLDHCIGNIKVAAAATQLGIKISIISEETQLYFLSNSTHFLNRRNGYSFSLFSLTESCHSLSVTGAKYPLDNAVLNSFTSLGLSNEWVEDSVHVSVGDGVLLIIVTKTS